MEPLALRAAEETLDAVHTRRHVAYPAYKPSGVEWLGDVPEHWAVKRLKWDSAVFRGASPRPIDDPIYFDDDGEYAWVRISDVTAAGTYLRGTKQRLSELGASLSVKLASGDLFLSIAGSVGKPCIAKIKCCIHDGFVYFPRLSCDRKFLYYIFASGEPYKGLGKLGTQLNLNTDTVGSISMAFPPLEEQQAIARFLDEQTRKMDDLIEAKRGLLDLLKEKRQAVITHAVTRGLDPAAKLKPSGVEWLGDVPEHWDVKPLKRIVGKIGSGKTPRGGSQVYVSSGVMLLRSQNVYDDGLRLGDVVFIDEETDEEMSGTRVKSGDVLLNITGASIGRSSLVPDGIPKANVNQHVCIIRPTKISAAFLHAILCSKGIKNTIASEESGTSREGLNFRQIGRMTIPVLPLEEQQTIAHFLGEETQKIDDLESVVREAIATLELLRVSIISAAVTGKIDVRGATVQTKP